MQIGQGFEAFSPPPTPDLEPDPRIPLAYQLASGYEDLIRLVDRARRPIPEAAAHLGLERYPAMRERTGKFSIAWRQQRENADHLRAVPSTSPRANEFKAAFEAAELAYEEKRYLLWHEEQMFRHGRGTLDELCQDAESGYPFSSHIQDRLEEASRVRHRLAWLQNLASRVLEDLERRHPDLVESVQPLSEIPTLSRSFDSRQVFLSHIPKVDAGRVFDRIDAELALMEAASARIDAEFAADTSLSALGFTESIECGGDATCAESRKADLAAAQSATQDAEAARRAADEHAIAVIVQAHHIDGLRGESFVAVSGQVNRLRADLLEILPELQIASQRALSLCQQVGDRDGFGCYSMPTAGAAGPDWGIRDHVFQLFNERVSEPDFYGAYTYVILPMRPEARDEVTITRYTALLEAIVDHTLAVPETDLEAEKLNLFSIPSTLQCERDLSKKHVKQACDEKLQSSINARQLINYDTTLALSYFAKARGGDLLRKEVRSVMLNSPGPFLLTLPERLNERSRREGYQPFLLLDLSRFATAAFVDVIGAYKSTIVEEPPSGQVVWDAPASVWFQSTVLSVAGHLPDLLAQLKSLMPNES
jgi:hypothetical protein